MRAVQKHQQGDLEAARLDYELLLQDNAEHAEAWHLLGVIDHQSGQHREAIEKIERALQLQPEALLFRKNLASAYRSAGEWRAAQEQCELILEQESEEPIIRTLLGRVLQHQQQWTGAIRCYQQVLAADSDQIDQNDITIHLGDCYSQLGQHARAAACFESVLAIVPDSLLACHNLAREYQFQQQFPEAEQYYYRALEIDPQCSSAWNNLGVIHQTRAEFVEAQTCFQKARELNPRLPDVHNNLANVFEALGALEPCEELLLKAIELRPDYAEAHHSLGQIYLRTGDFPRGWSEYHWRYQKKDHDHRPYAHPEWTGQPLETESLLIFSEQGIGDVMMFASCLSQVCRLVQRVTLEVDVRMVPLFTRSFPHVQVIARPECETTKSVVLPGIDWQISLADLPQLFRLQEQHFPRQQQWIVADEQRRAKWRARYAELGEGLKIGLSWFGGKNLELQSRRSIPLAQWSEVFSVTGVHWINLQYGERRRNQWDCLIGVELADWPDCDPLQDLEDFAAQIAELDLVISIDNATVHFAGALGVPTWCLLSKIADWRWMLERDDTLWYSTLRLFRQQSTGDWQPILTQIASELRALTEDIHLESEQQPEEHKSTPVDQASNPAKQQFWIPHVPNQSGASNVKPVVPAMRKPRCAIISPVGPGHAELYAEAENSIREACRRSSGPFREVIPFRIDDEHGQVGRSRSRNFAVQQAALQGIEWVFFLDADDLLVPDAFVNIEPYLEHYDAIWGQIYSFQNGTLQAHRREGQLEQTDRYEEILAADPFLSLQMGHFVKTEIALKYPFDEAMNVGEDFDYYLRVWKAERCVKLNLPLFANRRGSHSSGPRSATGAEWTAVVHQMLQVARQGSGKMSTQVDSVVKQKVVPDSTAEVSATKLPVVAPMKVAIYGMMRSGTTLLGDKLTLPGRGLVLLEPNILMNSRPDHLRLQLDAFGIHVTEQEWTRGTEKNSFQEFFDLRILPQLQRLDYWGVKMVNFSGWKEFLAQYPAEHLILCVRDIRDVVLSALDLAPKLNHQVDEAWIERRALETAACLVEMAERTHILVRYEDLCASPERLTELAEQLELPGLGDQRLGLASVPHRLYEEEKHGGVISTRSVQRFREQPEGPAKRLAEKVWRQARAYCEKFGYEIPHEDLPKQQSTEVKVVAPTGQQSLSESLSSFWQQDRLANIIPANDQLGEFPEGWDVRPLLWQMLGPHVSQTILEIGCGYGRLSQAFPKDYYLGVDLNPEAVEAARNRCPGYAFETVGFEQSYPAADAILAYTLLLHIDDYSVGPMLARMCQASDVILIAEILGRKRWRRPGNPPVFNRDLADYVALMQDNQFRLESCQERPYEHYPETKISFLKFVRDI